MGPRCDVTVAVVEDNDLFRETLELLLAGTPDVRVVASAADGRAAVEVCARVRPDVVLMDYRLPGLDGVEATSAIRRASPETAVVVLTAAADDEEIAALREAGAAACVTKDRELDAIVAAIREAASSDEAPRDLVAGQ